jgi:glycosyltransferase involved in cell wall biosynthesis
MDNLPLITILLATYNGQRHLVEQLDSIFQQTHQHLKVVASDDGSTDRTLEILQQYPIQIHAGPGQGFAANFLYLIELVDDSSDYYAFSDQDDVWDLDKLQRSIDFLASIKQTEPALYCGRTLFVNENLECIRPSPLFKKPSGFLNALVQNIAGGNTMVFNRAAFNLLRQTKNKAAIVSHDWWAYILISGAGGHVFYDPIPSLRYRQHQNNLIGSNHSWLDRFYRIRSLFQGQHKARTDKNNQNLLDVAHLLTVEHQHQLETFERVRRSWIIPRIINLMRLGLYRQTIFGQIGLVVAAFFNKL